MLAKKFRLNKNRDIRRVMQRGVKISVPDVRLQYLTGNRLNHPRVAVLVSTKISKSAVKRNLLKRRVRSLLLSFVATSQSSADIIVTPFKELDYDKLEASIKDLLSRMSHGS